MNFNKIFNDNIDELIGLLNIKSIYDPNTISKETPFGKGINEAFEYMKGLANKYGLKVKEYDHKVLSISLGDNGLKHIDIPCHIDVVEVNNDWQSDPFKALIKDNKIIARGSYDMKTATYLTFLCLRLLKEENINSDIELRLVIGTDEERTMDDMRYYLSLVTRPLFAYTPDGLFPMIIGEKGALMWKIEDEYDGLIESFKGGIQCNVVAPKAKAILKDDKYYKEINKYIIDNKIKGKCYLKDNKTCIEIEGKAFHASLSFLGVNAIILLLKILKDVCEDKMAGNLYSLFADPFGEGITGNISKEQEGLTINLGILNINNNKIEALIDGRYPDNINSNDLTNILKNKCIYQVSKDYDDLPTQVDIDDKYVKILLDNYRRVTSDLDKPMVVGSVSYSKVFKHCVGFGIGDKNREMMAHQKDEYLDIDQAIMAFEVYYKSMLELLKVEDL